MANVRAVRWKTWRETSMVEKTRFIVVKGQGDGGTSTRCGTRFLPLDITAPSARWHNWLLPSRLDETVYSIRSSRLIRSNFRTKGIAAMSMGL